MNSKFTPIQLSCNSEVQVVQNFFKKKKNLVTFIFQRYFSFLEKCFLIGSPEFWSTSFNQHPWSSGKPIWRSCLVQILVLFSPACPNKEHPAIISKWSFFCKKSIRIMLAFYEQFDIWYKRSSRSQIFFKMWKICNIHRKAPVLGSLFNKVAGLKVSNFCEIFKGPLSGLCQFLTSESPLKMMKMLFISS